MNSLLAVRATALLWWHLVTVRVEFGWTHGGIQSVCYQPGIRMPRRKVRGSKSQLIILGQLAINHCAVRCPSPTCLILRKGDGKNVRYSQSLCRIRPRGG